MVRKRPSPEISVLPSMVRAGNLFGTTRSDHPGEFGAPLFLYARISGGVVYSFPLQKGQNPPAAGLSRCCR